MRIVLGEDGRSCGGGKSVPYILDVGGLDGAPVKSLLVRRCIFVERLGICFSVLISSNVGMTPEYQAEGEDGEPSETWRCRSSGNIGLGLCILPSDPLLRRAVLMP